jgi:glycosyltransferase involved in cell wall biosynthesis
LISDGYSTDGTYEICEKMAQLNKKIKLFRDEWPSDRGFNVLSDVTNTVRVRCNGDYLLSIQANESIHEESVTFIRALPEIFPKIISFSLPFIQFLRDYQVYQDFRLRFAKNDANIVSVSDAWTLGLKRSFVKSEMLKSILHPKRLLSYAAIGVHWTYHKHVIDAPLLEYIYLPKPIYRYWSLFPHNHLEKAQKHIEMHNEFDCERERIHGGYLRREADLLKNDVNNPEIFWKKAIELREKHSNIHYPEATKKVNAEEHPKIMQGLLLSDSTVTHYYVRDEVLNSIKNL